MHRELGSDVRDLPHAFIERANRGGHDICDTCERGARHPLHHVIDIEQASHRPVLQTEKGS